MGEYLARIGHHLLIVNYRITDLHTLHRLVPVLAIIESLFGATTTYTLAYVITEILFTIFDRRALHQPFLR